MPTRLAVQTDARAGSVGLLTDYAASASLRLQVYRARPRSLNPPVAFIDRMGETLTPFTLGTRQRVPRVEILCLWGQFDSGEAVDQRDAFVDGFLDWCADNWHAFGGNTDMNAVSLADEPEFTPDWGELAQQSVTYYATRIVLEGFAAT